MKNHTLQSGTICCLAISLTAFRIFTSLPLVFTFASGTGAPISALLSGLLALAVLFFALLRYKETNIIDRTTDTLGAFGKYAVSILALVYLAISALFTLTEFSQFAKITAFPTTPLWFVALCFIVAAGISAAKEISPLLRVCRYFIPVFAVVVFLIILSVLWNCDLTNLFPLLGTGVSDTLVKGLGGILIYSDLPIIFLITRSQDNSHQLRRRALLGSFIGVLICFFTVLAFTAKIPYPLSKDEQFPFYLLMKEVYYGRFLQRVDAVVLLISALWGMFSLCLNLSIMTKILGDVFEISSKPAALFPLCAALFFLSIMDTDRIFSALLFSAAVFAAVLIVVAPFKKGGSF